MIILKKESNLFKKSLKKEHRDLLTTIQALPGINVHSYNFASSNSKNQSFINMIFLHVEEKNQEGLFFLSRCCDIRYWTHGDKWRLVVEVGDSLYLNGDRPIVYILSRKHISDEVFAEECTSLVENLNYHFNQDIFIKYYKIDKSNFSAVDEVAFNRNSKLKEIGI